MLSWTQPTEVGLPWEWRGRRFLDEREWAERLRSGRISPEDRKPRIFREPRTMKLLGDGTNKAYRSLTERGVKVKPR